MSELEFVTPFFYFSLRIVYVRARAFAFEPRRNSENRRSVGQLIGSFRYSLCILCLRINVEVHGFYNDLSGALIH